MPRTVGIGKQDFEKIRKSNCFYVDKTRLIKEWWENQDDVTLITRPRRFGKTLNMSMLEQFFSLKYTGRGDLFEGLAIWQEEKYRQMQGTYPVIALSFADVKETNFKDAKEKICQLIVMLYEKHRVLTEGNFLSEQERQFWRGLSAKMENYAATLSLKNLSALLERHYGRKTIILLDEYDTPMQEAYMYGYWDEMAAFMRSLFNTTFKTNPHLERAILTGITRVGRESVFSDLNNLEIVTTTSEKYETAFGFTEQEVLKALQEFGLEERMPDIRTWYDGFCFGRISDIYNPWSVINYLDKQKLSAYWANTSSNDLAGKLIREGSPELKTDFEELMRGGMLEKRIDEQIVFQNLSTDENAVWSLLLASGYLKAVEHRFDESSGADWYRLAITNMEVGLMFRNMIRGWFAKEPAIYNGFVKALLNDDVKSMNVYMNRVALSAFSYFDTGKRASEYTEPERFYHGFVLGLLVELENRYRITSNRESGYGRYDVVLKPRERTGKGIILEFKIYDPEEEKTLEDTVKSALEQIEREKYAADLIAEGITEECIYKYGFAFEGKKVLIGR